MNIKYFPVKSNGELRKTPIKANSLIELHSELKNYYGVISLMDILNGKWVGIDYAIIDDKTFSGSDVFIKIRTAIDEHNKLRQENITSLFNAKKEQLTKQLVNFSEDERKLFHLLHENLTLQCSGGCNSWGEIEIIGELFFKDVSLSKIRVTTSELNSNLQKQLIF